MPLVNTVAHHLLYLVGGFKYSQILLSFMCKQSYVSSLCVNMLNETIKYVLLILHLVGFMGNLT